MMVRMPCSRALWQMASTGKSTLWEVIVAEEDYPRMGCNALPEGLDKSLWGVNGKGMGWFW
jgi:hypothetical protein